MTGSPALLLLLTLGLCCPRIHGHRYQMTATFRNSRTTHPQVGQRLELECQTTRDDGSIFWIHQDKGGTLHFIVFTSSLSQNNFKGNTPISTRFEAKKYGKSHHLVVKSFSPQDEGNYFCLMNINRVLYFSPPLPVLLPVVTTITTVAPTTQHNITEKDPCLKTRDPGSRAAGREKEIAGLWSTDTEGDPAGIFRWGRGSENPFSEGINSSASSHVGKAKDDVKRTSTPHMWPHWGEVEERQTEPGGLGLVLSSAGDTRKLLATCAPSSPQETAESSSTNRDGCCASRHRWWGKRKPSATPPFSLSTSGQVPWLQQSWL
ncbi:T-cell surface glycoprotein CD8 alpha chain isoform X1 [Falco rusticolus]|uniref:T-cell surface glycoprotein CD8 alpha chain isoform X1 n=1 Tax=Falco rusticolus TaxID=120794 RepID=UPI0018867842|nr:T-cell surface glycoprotein CD8 alpha chain isoform X1 [Falco rusticolus]